MKYEDLINDYLSCRHLHPEQAKLSLQKMEQWEEEHPEDAGKHFFYSSQFCYEQGDLKESLNQAIQGIRSLISKPYMVELVKCYNMIGVIYDAKGNNKLQALDYYLEALDLAESHHDTKSASGLYNNIGCLYDSLQDYESSIYYFLKAFEYYEQDKNDEMFMMEALNLALMYCEGKDWHHTYYYYEQALHCKNPQAVKVNRTHLLLIQCLIAHHQKKYEETQTLLEQLYQMASEKQISIGGFFEISKQLKKLLDPHYQKEIKQLLNTLYERSQSLGLLNAKITVIENAIEYCKMLNYQPQVEHLSYQYYELSKENMLEHTKMLIDGMDMKMQMRSLVREHQEMERVSKSYKEQAEKDALTKIYNRAFMKNTLEPKFEKATQKQHIIGVVIFDVNDFKQYNDCYGHVAGDYCIREIGAILLRHCDKKTFFVRYGGDEFLGLFFHQRPQEITHLIQLIYAEVKALNIPHAAATTQEKFLSVTAGAYIGRPQETLTLYDYIRKADDQLYQGKKIDKTIQIHCEEL